ncbi:MAG: hypothetical protein SPL82_12600 [Lachnospiraceae bacterium]|nr:hypothetical protein [Lachnospiraceae bacterium]MDY6360946.1 hypothetical protein [Lachnospiraceae bacterium]
MRYDNKNHKIYNPRRDSGSCLDILILLAIVLIILPFAGTYKCVTAKTEEDKVLGAIMIIIGLVLYGAYYLMK